MAHNDSSRTEVQEHSPQKVLATQDKLVGCAAGLLAGAWLATGIGVTTILGAPLSRRSPCLMGAIRVLTGVRVDDMMSVTQFFKTAFLGAGVGSGLFLTAAALNWMIEIVDSINGDKP
jgi:hypothetical protein